MKLCLAWFALFCCVSLLGGCSGGAPTDAATPDSPGTDAKACTDQAANSPEHCECLGGYVKGDIGDGKVACTDGDKELERTNQGIEGAVCCQKAEATPAPVASGPICGTRGAAPCAEGQFCDYPLSANCGATDHPGTCQPIPAVCTMEYKGVCGCDGKTYATRCTASAAGVSLVSESPCE